MTKLIGVLFIASLSQAATVTRLETCNIQGVGIDLSYSGCDVLGSNGEEASAGAEASVQTISADQYEIKTLGYATAFPGQNVPSLTTTAQDQVMISFTISSLLPAQLADMTVSGSLSSSVVGDANSMLGIGIGQLAFSCDGNQCGTPTGTYAVQLGGADTITVNETVDMNAWASGMATSASDVILTFSQANGEPLPINVPEPNYAIIISLLTLLCLAVGAGTDHQRRRRC